MLAQVKPGKGCFAEHIQKTRQVLLVFQEYRFSLHAGTKPVIPLTGPVGAPAGKEFFRGRGCARCKGMGFSGRTGIFEVLVLTDPLRRLLESKSPADEIRRQAMEEGMRTLRQDGMAKVEQGITTLEEVLRVTDTG